MIKLKATANTRTVLAGLFLLCMSYSPSAFAQQPPSANEINNPGFENKMTDWEIVTPSGGAGSGALDIENKRSGNNALRLSKTNSVG